MRSRLLISLLCIAALAIAAFAAPLALAERGKVTRDVDADLLKDAQRIAALLPENFIVSGADLRLPSADPDLRAAVYDDTPRRVAGIGPQTGDGIVRDALDSVGAVANTRGFRVRAEPVVRGDQIVGAVRVAEPLEEITDRVHDRWLRLGLQAAAVLAVAAVAAVVGARRLARPVTALHDAAVRLGQGDFAIDVPHSGIAELDQSGAALNAAAARLGNVLERERAFSADVSHQLRTPITSLRATLESEQIAPRPDPSVVLREALVEVDRLEATVSHLLALTRDVVTDRQILPLDEILSAVQRSWGARLGVGGRSLLISGPTANDVVVHASRSAVEQILDVLVANAAQHGAGDVTIRVASSTGQGLAISVHDEGPGVVGDPKAVFERRVGTADSHGIGLALASTLATAEGGRLALDAAGPGPTFRLTLPPFEGFAER